jgi:hypothetical protein
MKKLIAAFFFAFILTPAMFSQTVYEHSNDFEQIYEQFKQRTYGLSENYNYFSAALETVYFPVLNKENKAIAAGDKFYILYG